MLDAHLTRLDDELKNRRNGYVERFEGILGQVAALHDPACIARLLPYFDDDAEYDEMMFSIIHTIENFDDESYVGSILDHLDTFFAKSPRWAAIVHMRILNSAPTLATYTDRLKRLPNAQRQTVRNVLKAVRRKNAKFETHCDSLLATL